MLGIWSQVLAPKAQRLGWKKPWPDWPDWPDWSRLARLPREVTWETHVLRVCDQMNQVKSLCFGEGDPHMQIPDIDVQSHETGG